MALIQYDNEYSRLKKVVLYRPSLDEIDQSDAAAAMYSQLPSPNKVLEEFDGIVAKLQGLHIDVTVLEPRRGMPKTSNMIFLRDVALIFRDKILLANMKYALRKDEPQKFKDLLIATNNDFKDLFVELVAGATMEGADIFVITKDLLYVYAGNRTSHDIVPLLQELFEGVSVKIIQANIRGVPQHILGGVHILDDHTATRRTHYCTDVIEDYKFIDFEENNEIGKGFSLNILTLSPREILMPEGNPGTKKALEDKGITCHEVGVSEIHKMGGGLACMVLPLFREKLHVD